MELRIENRFRDQGFGFRVQCSSTRNPDVPGVEHSVQGSAVVEFRASDLAA